MTSQPEHRHPEPDVAPPVGAAPDAGGVVDPDSDPPDDCVEMVARLYYFLDGELTDERRSRIQAHLDRCPSCFGAFDFEAELRMVVASRLRSHVPPHLADRIRLSLGGAAGGGPLGADDSGSGPFGPGSPFA